MENVVHGFDKMSSSEKIIFLNEIFQRQRLLAEQTLTGWFLIVFLNEINNVYAEHRDHILNEIHGKNLIKPFYKLF